MKNLKFFDPIYYSQLTNNLTCLFTRTLCSCPCLRINKHWRQCSPSCSISNNNQFITVMAPTHYSVANRAQNVHFHSQSMIVWNGASRMGDFFAAGNCYEIDGLPLRKLFAARRYLIHFSRSGRLSAFLGHYSSANVQQVIKLNVLYVFLQTSASMEISSR